MTVTNERRCTKCGTTKAVSEFRTRRLKNGSIVPASWCRLCLNEAAKLCMREHIKKPEVREQMRKKDHERYVRLKDDPAFQKKERERSKRYLAKPEAKAKMRATTAAWAARYPERVKENRQRWLDENREKAREYGRKYRTLHRERYLSARVVSQGARRWRMFNQGLGVVTKRHVVLLNSFWGGHCAYCGGALTVKKLSARVGGYDHVIPLILGGGHGPENVVSCCKPCNDKKNARMPSEEFLAELALQIDKFMSLLPPESYFNERGTTPEFIIRECWAAEMKMAGLGVPVGTKW